MKPKKILIVGGSKGIGAALGSILSKNNEVINISRSDPPSDISYTAHYSLDVLEEELPKIEELDGFIYAPGSINLKPFNRLDEQDFLNDMKINILGAIKCIQKYLDSLKKSEDGSVLLFSTVAVKMGMPFHASIASAKGAIEGLIKSLAAEYAATIRFNAIAPTVTNTDLASKLLRNEKMVESIKDRHPMKTFLEPEDVAETAAFLISDKAKKITGQIIEMDCGIVTLKT
ncbi:SDR family NAD(P)-dependent oxidoreductase [Aegicerativicinus sediminis]|uniref:SDR family NAD(P)-dependent oxidoreductase n=1 Tax=Aegicerativicinus sediminis TaxID=2893202 RepID=UPI001E3CB5D8|nr:SDR family oxidoreductase [Aegicerativicinus sediminis]